MRRLLLIGLVAAVVVPALLLELVWSATGARAYDDPTAVPPQRVAIVFGAGVHDGQPSSILAGRLDAAIALYRAGRVTKLLMSGDNSRVDYDEVSAMRDYAVARGVPAADVTLDHAGFSTYETCFRARAVFGIGAATLVTQRYHLARALYTCRELGVDAVGLGAPDWGVYADGLLAGYTVREVAATLNALLQVHVTRPSPTFLGPPIAIA